jgi:hypothetical protein
MCGGGTSRNSADAREQLRGYVCAASNFSLFGACIERVEGLGSKMVANDLFRYFQRKRLSSNIS